ncbi:MAG: hypothetical protein WCS88_01320 [Patescibacteria group bacterium]|jgi:hypothetical protein
MPIPIKQSPSIAEGLSVTDNRGISLVEVILSSALFVLLVTALGGSLVYGREAARLSGDRSRAIFLAAEGLEATRNIRDNNFSNLVDGTYGLATSSNEWIFSGSSDNVGIFTRELTISTISIDSKQVIAEVSWQQTPQRVGTIALTTYLNNWAESIPLVFVDCAEYCVSINYISGTCRQNPQQCLNNNEIYETGGDIYCPINPNTDTCCCL